MSRCANYCATKAALHSFAWTLRSQLCHHPNTSGKIRIVEIVPPAVKTELHSRQPDLVAAGQAEFGMDLDDFTNEAWAGLVADEDEIIVGPIRDRLHAVEDAKRAGFEHFDKMMRESSNKA
ncbi:hypothetical protein MAPG_08777 [Magnaporthiopsis poae ATCC 64411]|uniref:Short-chain dehydrogenase/reductase SDR n=1 Tax=Magnaporthiopsis poae (strain ATCC 64411 / 73-15) TaxID=644358 RepID=A0A0C4E881_MAGP6|nr:hypothetical protein MAPG_08777 [Magnaporthiopsis poae ATCC 64411]